jgi:hypothetical protein
MVSTSISTMCQGKKVKNKDKNKSNTGVTQKVEADITLHHQHEHQTATYTVKLKGSKDTEVCLKTIKTENSRKDFSNISKDLAPTKPNLNLPKKFQKSESIDGKFSANKEDAGSSTNDSKYISTKFFSSNGQPTKLSPLEQYLYDEATRSHISYASGELSESGITE